MNEMLSERDIVRKYQQVLIGILFVILTPLSILPGIPFAADNPVGWWHSVSQSYYANTGIVMIGFFGMAGITSIFFRARNVIEKILMIVLGAGSLGVVAFPHAYRVLENTGIFNVSGETSIRFHFVFAGMILVSMCFSSLAFAFFPEETEKKHKRNVLYISNFAIIGLASIFIAVTKNNVSLEWTTLVMEFIIFTLFGVDMLCCAGKIPFLR